MKKRLFRIASYLLILIMMMTNLPIAMAAPAEYRSLRISRENPHFAGLKAPTQITQNAPLYFSGGEEPTYHTDLEAAAQVIRDAMKARQDTFTVGYIVNENIPQDENAAREWLGEIAYDILLEAAFNETDDPTEGDSLRLCYYGETSVGVSCLTEGNRTKLALTYDPTYFTNAAQERELTAAVNDLLEEFGFTTQTTEKEKANVIYQWLCDNVDYDYTSPGYLKHSAYAAMVNKTAVCQGYAVLFYRLAEEAGLDARVIIGVATQSGELHGWNIARIGDYYYYLDSTWDANERPQNYRYYLRGENDFYGHTNDAQYESKQFRARYPIAAQGISALHGTESDPCDWKLEKNEEDHWYQCTICGDIIDSTGHVFSKNVQDGPYHYKECSCGATTNKEQHNFINYAYNEEKHWTYCDCGKIDTENVYGHGYGRYTTANEHWLECFCGHSIDREAHTWKDATCKEKAKCVVCGEFYGVLKEHTFGGYVYNNDATAQKDGTQTRTCSVCQKTETVIAVGTKIENPFKDVQVKEYYAEPVLWAVGKGITNGTAKDTFSPNNECTRGQIVTFLWRAAGMPEPTRTGNPFVDVKSDQYYYKAVLWAVEKGITTGTSANTFSPDAACTRGQVVTFMWRAKGKPTATADNSFKDVQAGAYYYDAVLWAVKNGITNGTAPGAFSPDATCTRGQIVTFLYRDYN